MEENLKRFSETRGVFLVRIISHFNVNGIDFALSVVWLTSKQNRPVCTTQAFLPVTSVVAILNHFFVALALGVGTSELEDIDAELRNIAGSKSGAMAIARSGRMLPSSCWSRGGDHLAVLAAAFRDGLTVSVPGPLDLGRSRS